ATNHPPSAAVGGPYTGIEGGSVAFDASGSSDPDGETVSYAWTFGDGSTGSGVKPTHVYADNGSYSVTLTVTDARGAASPAASTTATIANAAPVASAGAQAATAGASFTFSATFSDAGVNDGPWAFTIAWGDSSAQTTGSATSQASAITATHTYAAAGTDTVRITVADKDGATGSATAAVNVSATHRPPTAVAGAPYALKATFADPGRNDAPWSYAIDWGDGGVQTTGTTASQASPIAATHAYGAAGTAVVQVSVTDKDGAVGSATTTVTITQPVAS